jgi:hypothetical protein
MNEGEIVRKDSVEHPEVSLNLRVGPLGVKRHEKLRGVTCIGRVKSRSRIQEEQKSQEDIIGVSQFHLQLLGRLTLAVVEKAQPR